jgi:uncharacterized membrane protein YkoI
MRGALLFLVLLLGALGVMPAFAGHHHNNDNGSNTQDSAAAPAAGNQDSAPRDGGNGHLSLDAAVARVQNAYGGQVIAASSTNANGHAGYRIRVLLQGGRVRTVFVDAATGAMRD